MVFKEGGGTRVSPPFFVFLVVQLMNEKTILLIDAKNALYRSVYAVKHGSWGKDRHCFVALLRQMVGWINKFRPSSVHMFWDAPRKEVWRKDVLKTYKSNRDNNTYIEDVSADINALQETTREFMKHMNVFQYKRKRMEADDLLYAASSVLHPNKTIIVSTDSDMTQIPFVLESSSVYNPKDDRLIKCPDHIGFNPAWQKALTGDKADAIDGYRGIGPKKSAALLESHSGLQEFLDIKGREKFIKNIMLIDLAQCPFLLVNQLYVRKKLAAGVKFSKQEIIGLIQKYKVGGLMSEYTDLIVPFMNLEGTGE